MVFGGGTCGPIHVESFNRIMKALGSLRASGTPFAKQETRESSTWGTGQGATVLLRTKGRDAEQGGGKGQLQGPGRCLMGHVCVKTARADRGHK